MSLPSVSIAITYFLKGNLDLRRALASVVPQLHKDDEIVLVDDASNDDVVAGVRLEDFGPTEASLNVIVIEPRLGAAGAKNAAFQAARGDIIIPLDADDILPPSAIDFIRRTFFEDERADFVYGMYIKQSAVREVESCRDITLGDGSLNVSAVLRQWKLLGSSPFRRRVLAIVGYMDVNGPKTDDIDWQTKAIAHGCVFRHVDEVIYVWNIHPGGNNATIVTRDALKSIIRRRPHIRQVSKHPWRTILRYSVSALVGRATRPLRLALRFARGELRRALRIMIVRPPLYSSDCMAALLVHEVTATKALVGPDFDGNRVTETVFCRYAKEAQSRKRVTTGDAASLPVAADDGFKSFLCNGVPICRRLSIPYILFLCPGIIEREIPPWWTVFNIAATSGSVTFSGTRIQLTSRRRSMALHRDIKAFFFGLPYTDLRDYSWSFLEENNVQARQVFAHYASASELQRVATDPLFSYGSHSLYHANCLGMTTTELRNDLRLSRLYLENLFQRESIGFAPPYGLLHATQLDEVELSSGKIFVQAQGSDELLEQKSMEFVLRKPVP